MSKDSIWRFIPVSDFSGPTEPPVEQIRTRLMALWARLRHGATTLTPNRDTVGETKEKREIDQDVESLAGWPNWVDPSIAALDEALAAWRDAPADQAGSRVLVAPPLTRVESMLAQWAKAHDYRIIEPPSYTQMLQDSEKWLDQLPLESGSPFVIVALERCFLRHYNGLDLMRRLTQRIWQANLPCVLGCDSWAWAYLDFACHVGMLDSSPLTLAPLDAFAISRWIASTRPPDAKAVYRRTDSGIEVYPIHDREESAETDEQKYTKEFLVHVAAHANGNPAVAWALWRKSLTISEQQEIKEKAQEIAQDDTETIWVNKWETMELPAVPPELSDTGAFALHAILLHGGLGFQEIEYLVPGASLRLVRDLRALQYANVVEFCDERFHVTPLGYPTVRAFLKEESFLIDKLS